MATRTRTVMFTDMADFTATVARSDREGLRKLITEHEELVSPIVRRYHGRVVKNLGDSFMCMFESATDALRATLDIQDLVVSAGGISIRIGMTTGDVEEIDGDAFGDAVNQASRILNKAPAGEIWFGPGTRACMNAAEIPWESVGRFHLKGIAVDVEVYRAVPAHRCWLPDPVQFAARRNRLVRVKRGQSVGMLLPPEPVVLLEGFLPGSSELAEALGRLPVLDPASLFLAAYHISPIDRATWTEAGRGLVIGTPAAIDRAMFDAQKAVSRSSGADTIVLDGGASVDMNLVIAGLALPAVPLSEVVASYFYDLLPDGRWVNQSDRAVVRVEVGSDGARLLVTSSGVTVDGRSRALDEVVPMRDGTRVDAVGTSHIFRALDSDYVGVLLCDTPMRLGVVAGQMAEMGREPGHPGLAFPDRRGQTNIRWYSGQRAARAKAGGFTLDRALAGRKQASVVLLGGGEIRLTPLHPRCATYVLRARGSGLDRIDGPTSVRLGDHVVVGTTVVGLREPDDV
ncbi:MAG: adenylate/guanylate cyclase domain-containing protein [Alphaproteobacteria bacterium]|nr:adenylate/guanylate cyclase domain-containing protein [Alphaproteobacteria bacterium]